jgi:hypothetical protein
VGLLLACAGSAPLDAGESRSSEIVRRATEYVERYLVELTTLVAEERAHQQLTARPGTKRPQDDSALPRQRTWRADFATVRADDGAMLGFREILEVDGVPIENGEAIRDELFGAGHLKMATARRIADEAAARNLGRLRTFNTPVATLELLRRDRIARSRVKARALDGGTWQIEVEERERPTLVRSNAGAPVFSRATFITDGATGVVSRVDMVVGRRDSVRLTCRFERDPATGLLLPAMLEETFEEGDDLFTGTFVYANWRRFGTSTRIVKPDA